MREQMGTTTKKATFKTQLTQLAESGGVLKQVSEAFKTYQIARTNFMETLKARCTNPAMHRPASRPCCAMCS